MANIIANIFGSSPVQPLERHVNIVYQCAKQLIGFYEAVVGDDWETAARHRQDIIQLEHEADDVKKKIRLHLPKSLFMPVPRQDLLELLLVQDKIANRAKEATSISMSRQLAIPPQVADAFLVFVSRCVDAAKQARKSVRELDELFTTGFRGAEVSLVAAMIEELDSIETETDRLEDDLRADLFREEAALAPVDVMFLYQVIDLIGDIADMAERVGRRLELLLAH